MYFPFGELHEWGKRPGARPQEIDSEIPKHKKKPDAGPDWPC